MPRRKDRQAERFLATLREFSALLNRNLDFANRHTAQKVFARGKIFPDGNLDILESFRLIRSLGLAAGEAGDPGTETLLGLP